MIMVSQNSTLKNELTCHFFFNGCTCEKGDNVNIERGFSVHQVGDAELTISTKTRRSKRDVLILWIKKKEKK